MVDAAAGYALLPPPPTLCLPPCTFTLAPPRRVINAAAGSALLPPSTNHFPFSSSSSLCPLPLPCCNMQGDRCSRWRRPTGPSTNHFPSRSPSSLCPLFHCAPTCRVIDAAAGAALLALVGILSLLGVVAWAQHQLLFGSGFARSIRRGQLVSVLGGKATQWGGGSRGEGPCVSASCCLAQGLPAASGVDSW